MLPLTFLLDPKQAPSLPWPHLTMATSHHGHILPWPCLLRLGPKQDPTLRLTALGAVDHLLSDEVFCAAPPLIE